MATQTQSQTKETSEALPREKMVVLITLASIMVCILGLLIFSWTTGGGSGDGKDGGNTGHTGGNNNGGEAPVNLIQLVAPTNLWFDGPHLFFSMVPNVRDYTVDIDGEQIQINNYFFPAGIQYAMVDMPYLSAVKTYNVKVMSRPSSDNTTHRNSAWSITERYWVTSSGWHFTLSSASDGFQIARGNANANGNSVIPVQFNAQPVTAIGTNSFRQMAGFPDFDLKSVIMPNTITRIGDNAFLDRTELTIYAESKTEISTATRMGNRPVFWGVALSQYRNFVVSFAKTESNIHRGNLGVSEPNRDGFYFGGWGTMPECTAQYVSAQEIVDAPDDATYYAIWIQNGQDRGVCQHCLIQLDAPAHLYFDGATLYFERVEGVYDYTVSIDGTEYHINNFHFNPGVTHAWYTMPNLTFPQNYPVKVMSRPGPENTTHKNSIWSYTINYWVTPLGGAYGLAEDNQSYQVSKGWREGNGIVTIPATWQGLPVTEIGVNAFRNIPFTYNVTLPNTITRIGALAFAFGHLTTVSNDAGQLSTLKSINLGNSLIVIEELAFMNAIALEHIVLPNTIAKIGQGAFWGCAMLRTVLLPHPIGNQLTHNSQMFHNCHNLTLYTEIATPFATPERFGNRHMFWGMKLSDDKTYVVSFDKTEDTIYIPTPTPFAMPPYRAGYTFGGWSTSPDGEEGETYTAHGITSAPDGVTYYALWTLTQS